MSDRDEELEAVQRDLEKALGQSQGTPFVARPDEIDLKDGMLCWLDGTRVCGTDCVAFNVEELTDGRPANNPNQCLMLLYMGQQGAAAVSTVILSRKRIQEAQDRQREQMQGPKPPDPRGGVR